MCPLWIQSIARPQCHSIRSARSPINVFLRDSKQSFLIHCLPVGGWREALCPAAQPSVSCQTNAGMQRRGSCVRQAQRIWTNTSECMFKGGHVACAWLLFSTRDISVRLFHGATLLWNIRRFVQWKVRCLNIIAVLLYHAPQPACCQVNYNNVSRNTNIPTTVFARSNTAIVGSKPT
jgi:hypothetical protein